jgi:hypothetical protein
MVELYLYPPIRLHGVVLSRGTTVPFYRFSLLVGHILIIGRIIQRPIFNTTHTAILADVFVIRHHKDSNPFNAGNDSYKVRKVSRDMTSLLIFVIHYWWL